MKTSGKNTLVVNLYGGPGTGKSTNAARLFSMLKDAGVDVELVTEYAKDLVWEDSLSVLDNQLFVFANQHHRLKRLQGKVEVIVTDSPLLFSVVYGRENSCLSEELEALVYAEYSKFNNLDVFLNRVKPYNPNGRLQTQQEAEQLDPIIKSVLSEATGSCYVVDGNEEGCYRVFEAIMSDSY